MAKKTATDRSNLVNACGTILKSKRLKHGYTLVTRKRGVKTTTSATAPAKRKAGRPKKMTTVMSATAPMKRKAGRPKKMTTAVMSATATIKRKAGRPKKMTETITEKIVMTTPMRKAGRPAKSKSVMIAKESVKLKSPAKRRRATAKA
jgi:hypothetical protein